MGFFLAILFFLIAYISYFANDKRITHAFVFPFLWGIIMLAESFHFFGLYKSNVITYVVILVGVVSFSGGSLLFRRVVPYYAKNETEVEYQIQGRTFSFFLVVTILLLLYPAILNLKALIAGDVSMAMIRSSFGNVYQNVALALLYNYIALPFAITCLPIWAVLLVSKTTTKTKIVYSFLVFVVILEKIIMDAGRGILLYSFAMLFFAYKLFLPRNASKVLRAKLRKTIIWSLISVVIIYILITLARGSEGSNIWRQIYMYICGCVPFLDGNLQAVSQSRHYLWGAGGFHGVLQLVFTFLDNLRLIGYPGFMIQADELYNATLVARSISPTDTFNAYATAFYNAYLDGGLATVFIEMLLYGAASRVIYNAVRRERNNYRMRAIYVFILYGIAFSFIRFQFVLSRNIIAILFIMLVIRRKRIADDGCTD